VEGELDMALPDISVSDSVAAAEFLVVYPGYFSVLPSDTVELSENIAANVSGGADPTKVSALKSVEETYYVAGFYTLPVIPMVNKNSEGFLNVSISGTFVGTIKLQRSFDRGLTWHDYKTWTAVTEEYLWDKEVGVRYRIGCSAYTSGGVTVRLGTGG
jgi:hypothetical protein